MRLCHGSDSVAFLFGDCDVTKILINNMVYSNGYSVCRGIYFCRRYSEVIMDIINKIPTWLALSIIVACLLITGTMDYNDQIMGVVK